MSSVCADFFPILLTEFYEANSCWKQEEIGKLDGYRDLGGADLSAFLQGVKIFPRVSVDKFGCSERSGEDLTGNANRPKETAGLTTTRKHCAIASVLLVLGETEFVDASEPKRINLARHINHSCDPNAVVELWETPAGKSRAFVISKKDTHFNEEITINYGSPISPKNAPDMAPWGNIQLLGNVPVISIRRSGSEGGEETFLPYKLWDCAAECSRVAEAKWPCTEWSAEGKWACTGWGGRGQMGVQRMERQRPNGRGQKEVAEAKWACTGWGGRGQMGLHRKGWQRPNGLAQKGVAEDPNQDLSAHTYVPKPNDFSDLPEYFVLKVRRCHLDDERP
ncbi:hypothetical protein B0H14DRAFT_2622493 [Mycena olivaceomarginata]|nr:hypothetical protein B0H14DRAFT_2622493 [Mycena olivaceomarginata]